MPTDETLRRIREEWEKGHGLEDNDCQSELDDLQRMCRACCEGCDE